MGWFYDNDDEVIKAAFQKITTKIVHAHKYGFVFCFVYLFLPIYFNCKVHIDKEVWRK